MVIKKGQLAEITDCHKNTMNRVVYKFMLVGIALFLLTAFYFYISMITVTGEIVNVFFISLVAFCIYSIYLLVTKLSSIKLSIYLVWALGLFTTDIYVKDVNVLSKINTVALKTEKVIIKEPVKVKKIQKLQKEEKQVTRRVWMT